MKIIGDELTNKKKSKNKLIVLISICILAIIVLIVFCFLFNNKNKNNNNGDDSSDGEIISSDENEIFENEINKYANTDFKNKDEMNRYKSDRLKSRFPKISVNYEDVDNLVINTIYNQTQKWNKFINNGMSLKDNFTDKIAYHNKELAKSLSDLDANTNKYDYGTNFTLEENQAYIRYCIAFCDDEKAFQPYYGPTAFKNKSCYKILLNYAKEGYTEFSEENNKITDVYYEFKDSEILDKKMDYNTNVYIVSNNKLYLVTSDLSSKDGEITFNICDIKLIN